MLPLDSLSSAPVNPSFDCPSNLKEAIDWILRVTGKDGGGGHDAFPDFKQAIDAAVAKLQESEGDNANTVFQALQKLQDADALKGIIRRLTDGLRTFIGYDGGQSGIADLVDPPQQLRKGVLIFLSTLLEQLVRNLIVDDKGVRSMIGNAIKGRAGVNFDDAIGKVIDISQGSSRHKISDILQALKNVHHLKEKSNLKDLAQGLKNYLKAVFEAVNTDGKNQANIQINSLCSQLQALLDKVGQNGELTAPINLVKSAAKKLTYTGRDYPAAFLVPAVTTATENFLGQLKTGGYKSSYISTPHWDGDANKNKIVQVFLGCLPLFYYWLTYLYWKCKQTRDKGGWEAQWFNGRGGGTDLKNFMVGHGYVTDHLNKHPGKNIAPLLERFDKLKDSMQTASGTPPTTTQPSHTDLLTALDNSLYSALPSSHSSAATLNDHSLTALFQLCRCYFTGKQSMQSGIPAFKPRPPTSIREMLYWLSGLHFSPNYYDIEKQIESHIPNNGLHVADSGIASATGSNGDTLTQNHMKGFLLSSCLSAPGVLGAIQGPGASQDPSEPWLYSLFCNSMNLHYPSGAALFNALANDSYALQFQLSFLYRQCRTNHNQSYGWQWCRFGHSLQPTGQKTNELTSWICTAPNCGLGSRCQHNSSTCQHFQQCGQQNTSPLQAFLTDNLKGFHVSQKPDADSTHHLDNHPPGSMCHVPMGFASALTTDANATGWYIYYLLDHFCSRPYSPLRQLSEKLGCLTKRTPRTLGDLFGFMWHLNGQLFGNRRPTVNALIGKFDTALNLGNNLPAQFTAAPYSVLTKIWNTIEQNKSNSRPSNPSTSTVLSRSLEAMAPAIPFLYQMFTGDPKDFCQPCYSI
ncbi:variant erythrocyte surface antigen-1 family protein [Babesia caballi]|uniref:Variant erythrocyte surface antigen-1 family protein n=1 Tax=Babesia caballi TaxID=5871 RepID=A0AAV4LNS7_BABCB|nr:variant erythrocyte surface antigen-1 family protein [Babesia caballi]